MRVVDSSSGDHRGDRVAFLRAWRPALMTALAAAVLAAAPSASEAAPVACDVAIVGGGPGGVHTAYKLTTQHLTSGPVCLFEKSDHLGGRVGNNPSIGFSGQPYVNNGVTVAGSGQTGTGGYRMYQNQYTYALGQELAPQGAPGQLTFQSQNSFSRLAAVSNAGFNPSFPLARYFTYNNGGVAKWFAQLYGSPINDNDLFKALMCGPQVPVDAQNFPQYRSMAIPGLSSMSTMAYLQWVTEHVIAPGRGPAVAQYLLDVYRFRGDFDSPNDAVSYLEYSAKDFTGGLVWYPIPSFQPYFDIMAARTTASGGRIYLNEKILSVNTQTSGPRYLLTTSRGNTVSANTVIFATTHNALDPATGITGNITSRLAAAPELQYVQTTDAITISHQYGDGATPNSGWWHQDIRYPSGSDLLGPQLTGGANPLRRSTNNFLVAGELLPGCGNASCDFRGKLFFTNTNELPLTRYHDHINISRSVYLDQREGVDNWVALYNAAEALAPGGGNAAVNRQVLKSFRLVYPRVFTGNPATEPTIRGTQVTVHQPAWYNLKAGALAHGITNESLFAWSQAPLTGERVYLIGDAWRPDLSGWSDGAYKGSVYVLDRYFGAHIDPKEESTIKCVNGDIVDPD